APRGPRSAPGQVPGRPGRLRGHEVVRRGVDLPVPGRGAPRARRRGDMSEPIFEGVIEALGRGAVRYVGVGGLAVVLRGHARLTAALDLAVHTELPGTRLADLDQVSVRVAEEGADLPLVLGGRREERGTPRPERLVRAVAVGD